MSRKVETTGDRVAVHAPIVWIHPETGEEIWVSSGLDALGREMPDPVPYAPPVALGQHATLADTMFHILHHARLRELAAAEGFDSEEEANDFDIDDEPLPPGTTLFEAWADLAQRGLVEPPPGAAAAPGSTGRASGEPASSPAPHAATPPSPLKTAGEGGGAGGGVSLQAPAAPPPATLPERL